MTATKASFTFLVKGGEVYEFELEVFFLNTKTQNVEPLSSSPKSTPRANKKPFGPVEKVMKVDENIIKIENKSGDSIYLEVNRLSPLLDKDDSRLKATLIGLKEGTTGALVDSLNQLIRSFHTERNKRKDCHESKGLQHQETLPALQEEGEGSTKEKKSCGRKKLAVTYSYDGASYSSHSSKEESIIDLKRKRNKEELKVDQGRKRRKLVSEYGEEEDKDDEEDEEGEEVVDIQAYAELVIGKAIFRSLDSDMIQVPSCLKIDHNKVEDLKSLMVSTPDKTQTFCGVLAVRNAEMELVAPYWVYVNQELFIALKELASEGRIDSDKVPVIIHPVSEDDPVSTETIGMFLNTNSKSFTERLHDKLLYQDILRFCCTSVCNEREDKFEEVKSFLKKTLRGLSKGSQNVSTFLNFASLPAEFLNDFEEFIRKYETGSIAGQKISTRKIRNIDRNGKRNQVCRLELPLNLIKMHLKVSQSTRETLLSKLFARKMDLGEYSRKLKEAINVHETKKAIENIASKSFDEVRNRAPELFEDQVLLDFGGAKLNTKKYTKLVKHVKAALNEETAETPVDEFMASDNLNMISLSRAFKDYDIIIVNCGEEKDKQFSLTEHVKDSKTSIGILIKSEDGLREEVSAIFSDTPDITVVYIYTKVEKPTNTNGIVKEILPIVVFGHKDNFKDKSVRNFHNFELKKALQFVLSDLVTTKQKVLYTFAEAREIDIDDMGMLKRLGVVISYLAKKEVVSAFEAKMGRKLT